MNFPTAINRQGEINATISAVVRLLSPDVLYIRYHIDQDWSGDWGIFFRVVLSDDASRNRLSKVTKEVVRQLSERLDFRAIGVFPYHNFRSQSEQTVLMEPAWA